MTTPPNIALIVGDPTDPHAIAVLEAIRKLGRDVAVVNAESLASERWRWSADGFEFWLDDGWRLCDRGWLRRLAPAGAHRGLELGSRDAAESSARLAMLVGLAESGIQWLTSYSDSMRAENKLIVHDTAHRLRVPTPRSAVVPRASDIPEGFGPKIAVKPLGIGDYVTGGKAHAVYTQLVDTTAPELAGLHLAPFLIQEAIEAEAHYRIATVTDAAWSCRLDAHGRPADWREDRTAHDAWVHVPDPPVAGEALRISKALRLGYASQDWIIDKSGAAWLVDVNPGGQWLFLPGEVASEITKGIAAWLVGENTDEQVASRLRQRSSSTT